MNSYPDNRMAGTGLREDKDKGGRVVAIRGALYSAPQFLSDSDRTPTDSDGSPIGITLS